MPVRVDEKRDCSWKRRVVFFPGSSTLRRNVLEIECPYKRIPRKIMPGPLFPLQWAALPCGKELCREQLMKKMTIFVFFCMCLAGTAAFASVLPPEGDREMNWTRRPVIFNHQTHFAAMGAQAAPQDSCASCHHPVSGESDFKTCASEGCHDNLDPTDKSVSSYFQATHKKKKTTYYSCVSCHEERAGSDIAKKKQLAGCKESACHPS